MLEHAIEIRDLGRRFVRYQAISDVNLNAPYGAALALIGANGAGKSTLMRILVNILRPGSGSARVLGKDSRDLVAADFYRIGYLAENQKLPEGLSVSDYFSYLRRLYPNWDTHLETMLRDQFELPTEHRLCKLSHGMRMKAMLVGALAFRPALLILDEPLSGLDPLARDEVVEGLLGQAHETTILISSHEMSAIDGLATHVAFMDRGRLAFQCATEELLARFRQVTATFQTVPNSLAGVEEDWINASFFGRTFKFVDRAFTGEAPLRAELARRFGPLQQFDLQPMALRDISKALMLAARRATT